MPQSVRPKKIADAIDELTAVTRDWVNGEPASASWRSTVQPWLTTGSINFDETARTAQCFAIAGCCFQQWANTYGHLTDSELQWLFKSCHQEFRPFLETALAFATHDAHVEQFFELAKLVQSRRKEGRFYENLLAAMDGKTRKNQGVFFTPTPLAEFIVEKAEQHVIEAYGLTAGFADRSCRKDLDIDAGDQDLQDPNAPFIQFFEPSIGDGVFLEAIIAKTYRSFVVHFDDIDWSEFVNHSLLPRMIGLEVDPAAMFVAHMNLVQSLRETGFDFSEPTKLNLCCVDVLADARNWHDDKKFRPTVIVGNPPYGSLRPVQDEFCKQLLHGEIEGQAGSVDYFSVDGELIKEKKTWLNDIYVHFVRLCHWQLDRRGAGFMGLITNRGFLNNITFRGMRQQLSKSFEESNFVDFGSPERQINTDQSPNANPFPIQSQVAISIFKKHRPKAAERCDSLNAPFGRAMYCVDPIPPGYTFMPGRSDDQSRIYDEAMSLDEIFRERGSTIITARDWLVIDSSRERLLQRIERFRDLSIDDAIIRQEMCPVPRTRSQRYLPGNSRSWDLAVARRQLAEDDDWESKIRLCEYRPFDHRYIFWSPLMIDWPREQVSKQLGFEENYALIARRQSPPEMPCNFFWATRYPAIDGLLRSDNRGNESVFPYLIQDETGEWQHNFTGSFIKRVEQEWSSKESSEPLLREPEIWMGYIYGVLWSNRYRDRFAAQICCGFPRIVFVEDPLLAMEIAKVGLALLKCHTEGTISSDEKRAVDPFKKVEFDSGAVLIDGTPIDKSVEQEIFEYRIGAHQVARKFLWDRRKLGVTESEMLVYLDALKRIRKTIVLQKAIDALIEHEQRS